MNVMLSEGEAIIDGNLNITIQVSTVIIRTDEGNIPMATFESLCFPLFDADGNNCSHPLTSTCCIYHSLLPVSTIPNDMLLLYNMKYSLCEKS